MVCPAHENFASALDIDRTRVVVFYIDGGNTEIACSADLQELLGCSDRQLAIAGGNLNVATLSLHLNRSHHRLQLQADLALAPFTNRLMCSATL